MLELKYQEDGLIPAIIQDRHSGKVLMLGYMNEDAYQQDPRFRVRHLL